MKSLKDTKRWLKEVVIDLDLCPFAKFPFENNLIRISSSPVNTSDLMLDFFVDELALLELNLSTDVSTSLVIFSHYEKSFETFNQFSLRCDEYLKFAKLDADFQVVVFHPGFRFKFSKKNDRTNLVGQSPYPTLHILRNSEIDFARKNYPNIELIPENNRQKILSLTKKQ